MKAAICICISGFTQTRGSFHGILKLREELRSDGHSFGVANRVEYMPWTANWKNYAADLSSVCNYHGLRPEVLIAGYSYGGWGAIQLAKRLEKLGINVQIMILSDVIARPWFWPRPLPAVTSLLGRKYSFSLRVPDNVINLAEYYQLKNRPQGHRTIIGNVTRRVHTIELHHTHMRMDDAPEFHGCVRKYARVLRDLCEGNG